MTPRDTLNPLRLLWLAAALLTIVAACTPLGGWLDGNVRVFGTRSVRVAVQVADAGFGTKAAARTAADIGFYRFKLVNVGLATIAAQYQTTATAFTFSTVPNGTYQLKAEAFSAGGVSITAGGEQTSANTATVASPAVTYSSGSSLALTLPLLAGTGEMLYNGVIVTNGAPPGALAGASLSAAATVAGVFTVGAGPRGIAFDSLGNAWVACMTANTVVKLAPNGTNLGTYGVAGGPYGLDIDSLGNVWVSKFSANSVEKLDANGNSQGSLSVGGGPQNLKIGPAGNVWVVNASGNTVHKISAALSSLAEYSVGTLPQALAFDRFGNPLVGHGTTNDIRKLDPGTGQLLATLSAGAAVRGIAVDPLGYIWRTAANVDRTTSGGTAVSTYAGATNAQDVLVDKPGRVWVADTLGSRVVALSSNGVELASFAVGGSPRFLAMDQSGYVWVTCSANATVHKLKL